MSLTARPWTVPTSGLSGSGTARGHAPAVPSLASPSSHQDSAAALSLLSSGNPPPGTIQELDELHRKYRIMELTRKQSNEESSNTLRMQRQQIEKLKKDNDRLKEDLALETRQARQANNMSATAQIAKLQDQGDIYTRKIEVEKRRLEELDKQIKKMQNSILVQRKEMGGINATRESNNSVQKQIRILENRLDKALVKFNEALAHNKNLRDQIDNLRRERVVFDGIYNKLNKELSKKKTDMNDIMAEANHAYESRNAAQIEMIHLKEQADREQLHFEEEWKQLGILIDKDRKMKDFINKNKERERLLMAGPTTSTTGAGAPLTAASGGGGGGGKGIDPAIEEEQLLKKKVAKGLWGIATDKANIHLSMEKVQSYEEAFAKIQKATRITDIDELVHTFVHAEDQNFSLFNYVNDLSNEIEKIQEQIIHVRAEIERFRGQGENNDLQRKKLLGELEAKLGKNVAKAKAAQDKFNASSKTLHSLKSGIGNIFARLGCGNIAASELLGNAGVTESNMMQYLGIIEQRTNELLQLYTIHKNEHLASAGGDEQQLQQHSGGNNAQSQFAKTQTRFASGSTSAGGGGGHAGSSSSSANADALRIDAPSTGNFNDDEEEEDADGDADGDVQPLTRADIERQQQQQQDDY